MSPGEIAWRIGAKLRQPVDRMLLKRRQRPMPMSHVVDGPFEMPARCVLADAGDRATERAANWREAVIRQADGVLDHRLRLFDLGFHPLGESINWNYEYKAKRQTPTGFSADIDYRDHAEAGDCKFVWELSRHHHLVVLGRAFALTRDERYASGVVEQIESWMKQCPYGTGMNWRSPLELGIRLINWACAMELLRGSTAVTRAFLESWLPVVRLHLWEIARNYSRYSSANNHLIGEAAGVYVASRCFPMLRGARAWGEESKALLIREIERQTSDDGGNREQAFGYHLFVTQFFLFAGLSGRNTADDFPAEYWRRLERMFLFAAAFLEGGYPPMYGDADDGYVLDLGNGPHDAAPLMAVGATLFERPELAAVAGGYSEAAWWTCGDEGGTQFERIAKRNENETFISRALSQTGYWLLQCGDRSSHDRISLTFDCGPLGYQSIAAHGHADALSVTLRIGGRDILVDPGTYDYFSHGDWRDYFRSTAAHNTLELDGLDQSEPLGRFLWGRRAEAKCVEWTDKPDETIVAGEHDGYQRLSSPAVHKRRVRLDKKDRVVEIRDEVVGDGEHEVKISLHFGEECEVGPAKEGRFRVCYGRSFLEVEIDPRMAVTCFRGSLEPKMGWMSRGYHRKCASTTVIGRIRSTNGLTLMTRINVGAPPRDGESAPTNALADRETAANAMNRHPAGDCITARRAVMP